MATNKYKKYRISKNMDASGINYIARHGKKNVLIGKANTEHDLKKLMAKEAQKLEDEWVEETRIVEEKKEKKEARKEKREAKKVGLWRPGGGLKKNKTKDEASIPKSSGSGGSPNKDSMKEAIMKAKIKKAAADKSSKK